MVKPFELPFWLTGIQELGDDSISILEIQKSSLSHYRIRPQKLKKQTFLSMTHK